MANPWVLFLLVPLVKIVVILGVVILLAAYLSFFERKILAYMQIRIGPNRVGPRGWLQPIADALKLFVKEDILPSRAEKFVYMLGPVLVTAPALVVFSVIPFGTRVHAVRRRSHAVPHRRQHRHPLHPGSVVDRGLRDHPGRLGVQQQVLADGRAALGCAAGVIRGPDGSLGRHRAPDGELALARQDRRGAEGRRASGTSSPGSSRSSSTSCAASRRPTATRSTSPRRSPSSWRGSTPSTRG